MKYLIFGDVHGNLPALERLLEIEKGNYDLAVCHGDVVNYGPWSNECVELLDSLADIVLLKGNHEEAFLSGTYSGKNEIAKAFFNFCYSGFEKQDMIRKYNTTFRAKGFQVSHTIGDIYLYPDSDLSEFQIEEDHFIGHSHYQFDRKAGGHRIVNTGSVGQNRKIINLAEYVIYDDYKNEVELKSFQFDIGKVIEKMDEEKYPQICLDYYKNKNKICK